MKTFCILEQGGYINEPLTLKKKNLFTTEFSDFYRINWKTEGDPNAFVTQKGIVWSEGRSLLYEKIPKNYEYYIFVDDDMDFIAEDYIENIALKIKELLDEYKPISATFFDPARYDQGGSRAWYYPPEISKKDYFAKKVFPIAGYDPQIQIYSKSFADIMLPVIYHGSEGIMRYSQWACYLLFPLKQICFTEIQAINTRHEPHQDSTKPQYSRINQIFWLFNRDVKRGVPKINYSPTVFSDVRKNNLAVYYMAVDKTHIEFLLSDFAKIYDIESPNFRNRKSIVDEEYMNDIKNRLLSWEYKLHERKLNLNKIYGQVKSNIKKFIKYDEIKQNLNAYLSSGL